MIHKRIEWPFFFSIKKNTLSFYLWVNFLKKKFPIVSEKRELIKLHILILDFIWHYRGWRHFRGLPTRGQRTWSNAWTTNRANHWLRTIRLKWALKYYNNITKREAKIGFYAEYNNLLWKYQWRHSWLYAKSKRLAYLKKKKTFFSEFSKIDLKNTALGYIFLPTLKRDLTKKQKALQEKSIYAIGYNLGFSYQFYKSNLRYRKH